ncbi:NADH-ubiquinone oxidoreductase subunit [Intoshia linei]|uniref:Acyl carrier protein n=1 Tax=Intoshia linei TaxID=1819745 RepID=A0A177AX97_9BILA|nr:NADH-ubiquinone oxidoreductase subunit [Intoshia linei]
MISHQPYGCVPFVSKDLYQYLPNYVNKRAVIYIAEFSRYTETATEPKTNELKHGFQNDFFFKTVKDWATDKLSFLSINNPLKINIDRTTIKTNIMLFSPHGNVCMTPGNYKKIVDLIAPDYYECPYDYHHGKKSIERSCKMYTTFYSNESETTNNNSNGVIKKKAKTKSSLGNLVKHIEKNNTQLGSINVCQWKDLKETNVEKTIIFGPIEPQHFKKIDFEYFDDSFATKMTIDGQALLLNGDLIDCNNFNKKINLKIEPIDFVVDMNKFVKLLRLSSASSKLLLPNRLFNLSSKLPNYTKNLFKKKNFLDKIKKFVHGPISYDIVSKRVMVVLNCFDKIKPEDLTADKHFKNDLGLDSFDLVEITVMMEEEFQYEVPEQHMVRFEKPKDIIDYFSDKHDVYEAKLENDV